MPTVNPYLNFPGNTEEAFLFYKSVFGGEFVVLQRFRDVPDAGSIAAADLDKIMHVALPIGNATIIMGTDTLESMGQSLTYGNNHSLAVGVDSEAEATAIFNGLSAGGTVTMPLEKTFWNAFFGMCNDKFGIQWMVNYDYK